MKSLLLTLLLTASQLVLAQADHLQLTITDRAGNALTGATAEVLSLSTNEPEDVAVADAAGQLTLKPRSPRFVLRLRYLGYQTLTDTLTRAQTSSSKALVYVLQTDEQLLDEVRVVAVRAKSNEPFAFDNIDADRLAEANVGQDIPMLLRRTPGAVFTSDAGTGVGYTGIRIRGADATRINVTINGVPLNDAESQGVYWVNMPDFISSTASLQVQRGVGESTYGTGAFGANINLTTDVPAASPQIVGELGGGSFATGRAMLKASTGTLRGGFSAEARASYITSDGWVDRASSQLGSAYLGTAWAINDQQRLQLIGWTGKERTYQSWFGVPRSYLDNDELQQYNPAGYISEGNFYDDQTDNYRQSHAQALYSHQLSRQLLFQLTGHYTRGRGYYEEYKLAQDPAAYQLVPLFEPGGAIDLVRRLWLDNHFYGAIATISGQLSPKLNLTASAGINEYQGDHFGNVIRATLPTQEEVAVEASNFYENDAIKTSINAFSKLGYSASERLDLYADLQLRHLTYTFDGLDRSGVRLEKTEQLTFFNPKAGATFDLGPAASMYASAAVGQREPNRNDYVAAQAGEEPRAELLIDYELGLRIPQTPQRPYLLEANAYFMDYRHQLVPTGRLNDVGEYVRSNVNDSYRLGLELSAGYQLRKSWQLQGNLALSRARIASYTEFVDNYSTGQQEMLVREDVPIGFSPNIISNFGVLYAHQLRQGTLELDLWANTVSEQYLDNAGSEAARLDGYGRLDFEARYRLTRDKGPQAVFMLQLQNLLNNNPATNGYSYRYFSPGFDPLPGDPYSAVEDPSRDLYVGTGYYPQAGFQVLAGIRLELTR